jgi:hypothetical protein
LERSREVRKLDPQMIEDLGRQHTRKRNEAFLRIAHLLAQHCGTDANGDLDTCALSANEEAFDLLVREGFADRLGPRTYRIDWDALYWKMETRADAQDS